MTVLGFDLPDVSFARPDALWLMLAVPVMAFVGWRAAKARRAAIIAFGKPGVPGEPGGPRRTTRRWAYTLSALVVILLSFGVAGPQWGRVVEPGVIYGRDVIAVLDLSRSMLAQDVTTDGKAAARWEAGRDGLIKLADAAQRRGGHRLALVVFASRAKVVVPLTADYDHFRRKLDEIDGRYPPPGAWGGPGMASGTRIGAAVEAAAALADTRFPRATDILLVSDGDDPGEPDWQYGVSAARNAGVAVDVAGVGTEEGDTIRLDDGLVEDKDGNPVETKLKSKLLAEIARRTGGVYVPGPVPPLGEFFRSQVEPRAAREIEADALPRPAPRQGWFFGPALVLMVAALMLELRRTPPRVRHANANRTARADDRRGRAAVAR